MRSGLWLDFTCPFGLQFGSIFVIIPFVIFDLVDPHSFSRSVSVGWLFCMLLVYFYAYATARGYVMFRLYLSDYWATEIGQCLIVF